MWGSNKNISVGGGGGGGRLTPLSLLTDINVLNLHSQAILSDDRCFNIVLRHVIIWCDNGLSFQPSVSDISLTW